MLQFFFISCSCRSFMPLNKGTQDRQTAQELNFWSAYSWYLLFQTLNDNLWLCLTASNIWEHSINSRLSVCLSVCLSVLLLFQPGKKECAYTCQLDYTAKQQRRRSCRLITAHRSAERCSIDGSAAWTSFKQFKISIRLFQQTQHPHYEKQQANPLKPCGHFTHHQA